MSVHSLGVSVAGALSSRPSPDEARGKKDPSKQTLNSSVSIALSTFVSDNQEGEQIDLKGKEIEVLQNRLIELPADVCFEILRRLDLNDLCQVALLSKDCKRISFDPRLWRAIATEIECPLDRSSSKSEREQVIDFIKEIMEEVELIPDRTPEVDRMLKAPLTLSNLQYFQRCVKYAKTRDKLNCYSIMTDAIREQMVSRGIPVPPWAGLGIVKFTPEKLEELLDSEVTIAAEVEALFDQGLFESLRELGLNDLSLITIPPVIFRLHNMERLFINANALTKLPSEIGNLTNLLLLHLGQNRLTTLPAELWNLQKLETLVLDKNRLTTLPPGIAKLEKLEGLYLIGNQLTTLPAEIANLHRPKPLELSLRSIIDDLRRPIVSLHIYVDANPLGPLHRAIIENPKIYVIRSEHRELAYEIIDGFTLGLLPIRFFEHGS